MILQIAAVVFVLTIAFFQVVQGLYSALVMTVLSLFSAIVAFGYYESLAATILPVLPGYIHGLCLVGLFVLTLIPLRLAADYLIGGNVVLGVWADRIGGGVLGILTGMILIGVLTAGMQMVPFGRSIFLYQPFDDTLQRQSSLAPFYPDEFTVGLFSLVSQGSLRGENSFPQVHENLLRESYGFRNRGSVRALQFTTPDSLKVLLAHTFPNDYAQWRRDLPTKVPFLDETDARLADVLVLRVQVSGIAKGTGESSDTWFRLPATHFQVITEEGRRLFPVAYLTQGRIPAKLAEDLSKSAGGYRQRATSEGYTAIVPPLSQDKYPKIADFAVQRPWRAAVDEWLTVDWVFLLPEGDKASKLVFRRVATAEIPTPTTGAMPPRDGKPALVRWVATR
jgi:hypothetical protein